MNPKPRPTSVSIIGWFFLVMGCYLLIFTPIALVTPIGRGMLEASGTSPVVGLLQTLMGGLLYAMAGAGMLRGKRWGRQLYLFGAPVVLVLSTILQGTGSIATQIMGLVFYGAMFAFLRNRSAEEYFSPDPAVSNSSEAHPAPLGAAAPENPLTGRKIASILLLFPGGSLLAGWCIVVYSLAGDPGEIISTSLVSGAMTAAFVYPAIFLWGRDRWRGVLGTLITCVGGMMLMLAAVIHDFSAMEEFRRQVGGVDPAMVENFSAGSLVFGIGLLIVGPLLLVMQREKDKAGDIEARSF